MKKQHPVVVIGVAFVASVALVIIVTVLIIDISLVAAVVVVVVVPDDVVCCHAVLIKVSCVSNASRSVFSLKNKVRECLARMS